MKRKEPDSQHQALFADSKGSVTIDLKHSVLGQRLNTEVISTMA